MKTLSLTELKILQNTILDRNGTNTRNIDILILLNKISLEISTRERGKQ